MQAHTGLLAKGPGVTPGIDVDAIHREGVILNPGASLEDLPSLIEHLLHDFRRRGGRLIETAGHARVIKQGGRVRATKSEQIEFDVLLVATGP